MKTAADMVKVCETISNQLEILGVNDIRNVQTAIIDEQKELILITNILLHIRKVL
ncbi:MAG: hypothetical protein H6613_12875 [Ignavibacteriales bacterium]|nr:hypothetical protein [Ignavibacteriales bacterium]